MQKILVIDDDRAIRHQIKRSLDDADVQIEEASSGAQGLKLFQELNPDVVLLDIMFPDESGLELFQKLQRIDRKTPVIFITAGTDSTVAIEAMRLGAYDYVVKPLDLPKLKDTVDNAIESKRLMSVPVAINADVNQSAAHQLFVGSSAPMLDVFKQIGRVAPQDVTVLIRGESGTGKELVARALYQHSKRVDECFMAVNCAALPDQLLESELFGHEKGAFTGAEKTRIGKFEQCNGGTIFLDEVGDMTPLTQAKVLRLIQEQKFERVGGNETLSTDVRIIAATNRDLEEMVEEGEYRADLLYRLNGITINLPALRERGDDIEALLKYFLSRQRKELGKLDVEGISPQALEVLRKYDWPGNIRELQSVMKQSLINTTGTVVTPECLPSELTADRSDRESGETKAGKSSNSFDLDQFISDRLDADTEELYAEVLEMMEKELFTKVLRHTGGNQSKASKILGVTRGKIRDRIASFGIKVDKNITLED
ncbi:sigma-54-dependent transcriptional regulator [Calycomorphotria hydatis]|uniref:DNA-binding transcriptional regulator NtrC n=1 Tax=Calycomorphotria hydatis TaxID=2528027 RepID=A0A517T647_9PLAN|nr:sigma-54 dependent transcriptional regulator [Calycomorphotria hydatis]QDT63849.1 Transcriptional regulatory protein ZraR [Calycomorphotria hydatis]